MKRKLLTICACLAGAVGLSMLLDLRSSVYGDPVPTCDDKYASNGVGSCGIPDGKTVCSFWDGQKTNCSTVTASLLSAVEVKQDFPTECIYQKDVNTNCNAPDRDCWRYVGCKYDDDAKKCLINPDDVSGWNVKAKRETVTCKKSEQ
jgi:hypothetical protein